MSDVKCPYCNKSQEINHDDGYGYEEDETYEQYCHDCGKNFAYTTSISFSYDANKADCLNGGEHKIETGWTDKILWPNHKRCDDCGLEEKGDPDWEAYRAVLMPIKR